MPIGTSTDSADARAMINRCRVILIDRGGKSLTGDPFPSTGLLLADFINTKSQGIGWKNVIEADTAASTFAFWAVMSPYVVVKHKTTGVLYKVLIDPSVTGMTTYYTNEKTSLLAMNSLGKTWAAVITAYDSDYVIAMNEPANDLTNTIGSVFTTYPNPDPRARDIPIGTYLKTPEIGRAHV